MFARLLLKACVTPARIDDFVAFVEDQFRYTEVELTSNVRISTIANLKAEFHEPWTSPGVKYFFILSWSALFANV